MKRFAQSAGDLPVSSIVSDGAPDVQSQKYTLQFTGICELQRNPAHFKAPAARGWILWLFFILACAFSASENARSEQ